MINKQPNTFVNWHLSNDENSTKIKCVWNRFWQSKAAMKVQNSKRQVSRKMVTNKFPETKEQMVIKMISLSKQKVSWKKKWTQRLNPIFPLCRNRAIKILKQKSCVSKINDACNQRKTRLALLITRESSEQDAPCQTGNCYWRNNCLTLTQTTRKTFSKKKNYKSWKLCDIRACNYLQNACIRDWN